MWVHEDKDLRFYFLIWICVLLVFWVHSKVQKLVACNTDIFKGSPNRERYNILGAIRGIYWEKIERSKQLYGRKMKWFSPLNVFISVRKLIRLEQDMFAISDNIVIACSIFIPKRPPASKFVALLFIVTMLCVKDTPIVLCLSSPQESICFHHLLSCLQHCLYSIQSWWNLQEQTSGTS